MCDDYIITPEQGRRNLDSLRALNDAPKAKCIDGGLANGGLIHTSVEDA